MHFDRRNSILLLPICTLGGDMHGNRVKVIGFCDKYRHEVFITLNDLLSGYLDFDLVMQWNDDCIFEITGDGHPKNAAVTKAIDLPHLDGFLKNWQKILISVSKALPNTYISIEVAGIVRCALNGKFVTK
jgi:hypothetical protein